MSELSEIEKIIYSATTPKNLTAAEEKKKKKNEKLTATIFLSGVTALSVLFGFSTTLAGVKKNNPDVFQKNVVSPSITGDAGVRLALRALGWGSVYATLFCSTVVYGIWKISGAKSFEEFRQKTQKVLPKISKPVSE